MYSTRRQRLILTPLGTSDGFKKSLYKKTPLFKISTLNIP
jgi:hypothetical protein